MHWLAIYLLQIKWLLNANAEELKRTANEGTTYRTHNASIGSWIPGVGVEALGLGASDLSPDFSTSYVNWVSKAVTTVLPMESVSLPSVTHRKLGKLIFTLQPSLQPPWRAVFHIPGSWAPTQPSIAPPTECSSHPSLENKSPTLFHNVFLQGQDVYLLGYSSPIM